MIINPTTVNPPKSGRPQNTSDRLLHQTIKGLAYQALDYNTAISQLMIFS